MSVECFLDSNVLVYAAARDERTSSKRRRALELIDTAWFGISAQVLQEFYVTVTRKLAVPLSPAHAIEWIEALEAFPCLPVDSTLVKIGTECSVRFQISYWDGAILAAAQCLGAPVLFTEDLNNGQRYGSVTVRNPFLT